MGGKIGGFQARIETPAPRSPSRGRQRFAPLARSQNFCRRREPEMKLQPRRIIAQLNASAVKTSHSSDEAEAQPISFGAPTPLKPIKPFKHIPALTWGDARPIIHD